MLIYFVLLQVFALIIFIKILGSQFKIASNLLIILIVFFIIKDQFQYTNYSSKSSFRYLFQFNKSIIFYTIFSSFSWEEKVDKGQNRALTPKAPSLLKRGDNRLTLWCCQKTMALGKSLCLLSQVIRARSQLILTMQVLFFPLIMIEFVICKCYRV